MSKCEQQEFEEALAMLREAGVNAMVCNAPVAVSMSGVKCGLPSELGDESIDDYLLIPKALIGHYPEIFVPASGDSMEEAGYEDGDLLRIRFGDMGRDSDNVLAMIDGACTVKTLFTDEEGQKWLVPRNSKYDAIMLKADMDFRILGRVVGVEKASVRASSRELLQSIRRTRNKLRTAKRLSAKAVDQCIVEIGPQVKHARQWYAVQRKMVDREVAEEGDMVNFCNRVAILLPQHEHLPVAKELARMAVQSFAKPVSMWNIDNAPVRGVRFYDYLQIAMNMDKLLSGEG